MTIFSPKLCGIKDWYEDGQRYVVYLYQAARFEGELVSSDEGEVWWEELDNLPNLQLSLDMEDMIKVMLDDEISEFFYRKEGEEWVYDLN